MPLQSIPSITSSAPPAIEPSRPSLHTIAIISIETYVDIDDSDDEREEDYTYVEIEDDSNVITTIIDECRNL